MELTESSKFLPIDMFVSIMFAWLHSLLANNIDVGSMHTHCPAASPSLDLRYSFRY